MTLGERLRIATRYTFAAGQGHLSTFLSALSMLGLVLAIALLIVVLSVMNGFDKEMRERILSLVPHVTIQAQVPIVEQDAIAAQLRSHADVEEVEPFAEFDALVMRGNDIETARGVGLNVHSQVVVQRLLASVPADQLREFQQRPDGIVLGAAVARRLGADEGDRLRLIVPATSSQGHSAAARFKSVYLSAVLETGTELDEVVALVPLALGTELAGLDTGVSGFRIVTDDIFDVRRIGWELAGDLPPGYYSTNWMMTHGNLYAAIQLSRDLVSLLLFSIIAVAAFNVVSSLVLVVMDKRGNIAILRTLGASGADIAWVFVLQGAMIGIVGVVAGSLVGTVASYGVPGLVAWLEGSMGMRFLNTDVYPVSFVPVDLQLRDVVLVGSVALMMCVLAAVYPALRAARLAPAAALNQEL